MSTEGFSYDSMFIRLLNRVGDLFILSLTFVLFSLPVFTIGASLTALYYASMKSLTGEDGYIWKNFVKSFKLNFKQATAMWGIAIFVFIVLGVDVWFWYQQKKAGGSTMVDVFLVVSIIMFLLAAMIFLYAFPLQAKFDNKIKVQLRNAFFLSIKYFPTTLLLLIISVVILWAFYYQPALMVVGFLLVGFGVVGHLYGFFMLRCFRPYLVMEQPEDHGDEWHLPDEEDGDGDEDDDGDDDEDDDDDEKDNDESDNDEADEIESANKEVEEEKSEEKEKAGD